MTTDAPPDDEEFRAQLYRNLSHEEVAPSSPFFVDPAVHTDAFGPDVVAELTRAIRFSGTDRRPFFLSGTRGSGKSSQLLRLRDSLFERGYLAIRVDAEDFLNVRRPLQPVEILFALVAGIETALRAESWLHDKGIAARLFDAFRNSADGLRLDAHGALKADIPGVAELQLKLKREPSFADRLHEFLGARTGELARAADEAIERLVDDLRPAWRATGSEWKGLVVLFDSLDHVRGVDFQAVRRQLDLVLTEYEEALSLDSCQLLYVIPPWARLGASRRKLMTSVKVSEPAGTAFDPGVDAMVEIVRKRMPDGDLDRAFPDSDRLRELALDSGGHLRDMLRLVRGAIEADELLPFSGYSLARSRQVAREGMTPISYAGVRALRHVRATHQVPLPEEKDWDALAELFDRHLILGYQNGEVWYGMHPLVADYVERAELPDDD